MGGYSHCAFIVQFPFSLAENGINRLKDERRILLELCHVGVKVMVDTIPKPEIPPLPTDPELPDRITTPEVEDPPIPPEIEQPPLTPEIQEPPVTTPEVPEPPTTPEIN